MLSTDEYSGGRERRSCVDVIEPPGSLQVGDDDVVVHLVREQCLGRDHGSDISVHALCIGRQAVEDKVPGGCNTDDPSI